jgi:hypothetical protein
LSGVTDRLGRHASIGSDDAARTRAPDVYCGFPTDSI